MDSSIDGLSERCNRSFGVCVFTTGMKACRMQEPPSRCRQHAPNKSCAIQGSVRCYNAFTEARVLSAGDNPAVFYEQDSGSLRPEFTAHVDRLCDLQEFNRNLITGASELREQLRAR